MALAGDHFRTLSSPGAQPGNADAANQAPARLRSAFTITSRRRVDGHEHHRITAPKHGPDRAQARHAILTVLHHAEQRRHRVAFLITLGDYTQQPLTPQQGYDARVVLAQCRFTHGPYAWLQQQLRHTTPTTDTNSIIGVNIRTWPSNIPSDHETSPSGPAAVTATNASQASAAGERSTKVVAKAISADLQPTVQLDGTASTSGPRSTRA